LDIYQKAHKLVIEIHEMRKTKWLLLLILIKTSDLGKV